MVAVRAVVLVLAAGLTAAGASAAPRASDTSWGKPGVSIEDYAVDGGVCAYQAMMTDVSDTRAAATLVAATRRLANIEARWGLPGAQSAAIDHRRVVEAVRPQRLFEDIADLQQSVLDDCLAERGYRRFRLTDEQKRHLRRLRSGSPERRAYLHSLGSNPLVLERQGLHLSPTRASQPQG